MNRRLVNKLFDLEIEMLWRRISGKVKEEDREAWDETAWESLPMALILEHEARGEPRGLAPEEKVRTILRRVVTVPTFRGHYSHRPPSETGQAAPEESGATEKV
jgi:hypothetical protein